MTTYQGACHCGKNRYQIESTPEFQFKCYCSNCRELNGGGHLCGMMFSTEHFVPASETAVYAYPGGSNDAIELHFCPHCSTQLYAFPKHYADKVVVRANTLEKGAFSSQQNLFTETAFGWDQPDA